MAKLKSKSEAKLEHSQSWPRIPVHGNIQRAWSISSHDSNTRNRGGIYYRINLCVSAIALLSCAILPPLARANGNVGGVSATANPVATSSGSVTNQAIQMLTGPYPTSQFGGGISCQGPVLNVSPYGGASKSWTLPFEPYFDTPVYSTIDKNEDGYVDNPSEILYNVPTRTGQKDSYNINLGVSATISFPLDGSIQRRCKEAADANIAMMKQLTANKRLDFELARLKNCADQKLRGVSFHPKSPYYSVCADVVVQIPPGGLPQHRHTIPTSAETSAPPDAEKG